MACNTEMKTSVRMQYVYTKTLDLHVQSLHCDRVRFNLPKPLSLPLEVVAGLSYFSSFASY